MGGKCYKMFVLVWLIAPIIIIPSTIIKYSNIDCITKPGLVIHGISQIGDSIFIAGENNIEMFKYGEHIKSSSISKGSGTYKMIIDNDIVYAITARTDYVYMFNSNGDLLQKVNEDDYNGKDLDELSRDKGYDIVDSKGNKYSKNSNNVKMNEEKIYVQVPWLKFIYIGLVYLGLTFTILALPFISNNSFKS